MNMYVQYDIVNVDSSVYGVSHSNSILDEEMRHVGALVRRGEVKGVPPVGVRERQQLVAFRALEQNSRHN